MIEVFNIIGEACLIGIGAVTYVLFVFFFWVIPLKFLLGYVERKVLADFQARIGPAQNGAFGWTQGGYDFLRYLQKGHFLKSDWACVFSFALVFSSVLITPLFSQQGLLTEFHFLFPILLLFLSPLVSALPLVLTESKIHHSKTVFEWINPLRRIAIVFSGTVPAVLALLVLEIHAGGGSLVHIFETQGAFPHQWNLFNSPFLFLAGWVFYGATKSLSVFESDQYIISPPPFFGAQHRLFRTGRGGDQELLEGLTRFMAKLGVSSWFVILFLGGWTTEEASTALTSGAKLIGPTPMGWILFSIKTGVVYLMIQLFSFMGAREKLIQRMSANWKLYPRVGLVALLGQATLEYFRG